MRRSSAFHRVTDSLATCGEFLLFAALAPVAILAAKFGEVPDSAAKPVAHRTAVHPDSRT